MDFIGNKSCAEYPYTKKDVYMALLEAVHKIKGLKIDNKDESIGRITVKAGVNLSSWGENIPITIKELSPGKILVEVTSTLVTGVLGAG